MDTLLQVVALDDVVSLLAYSAAIAFALHSLTGRSSDPVGDLLVPIGTTLGMLVLAVYADCCSNGCSPPPAPLTTV